MKAPVSAIRTMRWNSPIGTLWLAGSDQALCGVWFTDQKGIPNWAQTATEVSSHPLITEAMQQLEEYFLRKRRQFDLKLDYSGGTPFQQTVWKSLGSIPYGATVSYGAIAHAIGRPTAVRAVGGAVGRNPLGIVLPCHRVLGGQGALTGYTGGIGRKVALLQLERG